jgi:flavin reductase (DIM6/NTAB) family NADH-FMN oxidoreductase RutF
VLVSSHWQGKHNIMTLGWHTVLEFSPSLVGCMISGQIQIEDDEGRSYDPQTFEKIHAHRT